MRDRLPSGSSAPRGADDAQPSAWLAASLLSESASDRTARYFRSLIFSGQLQPGDRLPAGRELAERLGISRVTLRLGLKALEGAGYLTTSVGSRGGTRVCDADQLQRCWTDWMRHNADDLNDIFEFRANIETRIAWLAAQRRTPEELRAIEMVDGMFDATGPSLFRLDVEYHHALARAAHSRRLEEAMITVRGELFLPVNRTLHEQSANQVRALHSAITAAVRDWDSERAASAMRDHIADADRRIHRALTDSLLT